jgi:hypothetical protein
VGLGVTVTCATFVDGPVAGWVACRVGGSFPSVVRRVGGAVALVGTDNGSDKGACAVTARATVAAATGVFGRLIRGSLPEAT